MEIFTRFLRVKLNQTGFGGVTGGSRVLMQKLILANQMASILELADQHKVGEKKSDKLHMTAFQRTIISATLPQATIKDQISSIFDWLLCQRDVTKNEVQNQPSVVQARKLRFSLLSLLVQASPSEELYDLEDLKEEDKIRGLNISLQCMIERVENIESQTLLYLGKESLSQSQALKIQENSSKIMMFLFKKWIVNDMTA